MKIYIAARFRSKKSVRDIYKILQGKGHRIIRDWTKHKVIKPYGENRKIARSYAKADVNGAVECDAFILMGNKGGTGIHVELGAAIATNIRTGKPKIYVIGPHNERSMFYFHPSVTRKNTIAEVIEELP